VLNKIFNLRREFGKFFSVGALGYVVGVGGFNLLVHTQNAPFKDKPLTGSILSGVASILVAYIGNRHWTWKDRKRSGARREVTLFFVINGITLTFGVICLAVLIRPLLTTFQQMLLVLALEQYLDSGAIERLSLSPTRAL